ncbi:HD domain-containing protein [Streptomyces xanthochromogenes]|uniref:HD domain-containing protein n=1 Tax=Streptomyces xanthochromogenes TaxID=67384 RepID=UPI0035711486
MDARYSAGPGVFVGAGCLAGGPGCWAGCTGRVLMMRWLGEEPDESVWAKSRGLDQALPLYPLVRHLLDTAAMALCLWDRYLSESQRRRTSTPPAPTTWRRSTPASAGQTRATRPAALLGRARPRIGGEDPEAGRARDGEHLPRGHRAAGPAPGLTRVLRSCA